MMLNVLPPECGYFPDAAPQPINLCGFVGYKVEWRVCANCSKNQNKPATPPPADPAVQAAIARQFSGCKGCGDPGGLSE